MTKSKVLLIYAHPYNKSFNYAILEKVEDSLLSNEISFSVIDLYKDNFNPAYNSDELSLFKYGETKDQLVKKYQKMIVAANKIIFIFPIWWNSIPAIIKGFIDKVMKKKFAYDVGSTGVIGHLTNIDCGLVFTTSTSPTWYLKLFCGDAVNKVFIRSTLSQLGMKNIKWINFGSIDKSANIKRMKFLNSIDDRVKVLVK